MALPFFDAGVASGIASPSPNNDMREMLQEYVNDQWENSTAIVKLQEQAALGSSVYNEVEAMIASVRDLITTGLMVSRDFIKVFFKDFTHNVFKGRYYKYEDNYWMIDDISPYEGVAPLISLRRCNNALRIIDPTSGNIFSAPCVVDYDMTSPMAQTSKYLITPNNHATIQVQANTDTMRLFKLNTRYIISGRPFKLLAMQNALIHDDTLKNPTVLYLDLYLDELHDEDDLTNGIADNGYHKDAPIISGYVSPDISSIRQYESITYRSLIGRLVSVVTDESYLAVELSDDRQGFTLTCNRVSDNPISVAIRSAQRLVTLQIVTKSIFGGEQ